MRRFLRGPMTISICIPVYRGEMYIEQCLDGLVEALKGLEYEIIMVDNNSDDRTEQLARDYTRRHGNIVFIQAKSSRGKARQLAFEASKGEYIISLEIDRACDTRKFRQMIDGYLASGIAGKKGLLDLGWEGGGILPRHVVQKVGGWRDLNNSEDVDFVTRVFMLDLAMTLPVETDTHAGKKRANLYHERRYARGLSLVLRNLGQVLDGNCGRADTCGKTIRAKYFFQSSPKQIIASCFVCLAANALNAARGYLPVHGSPYLSNFFYTLYKRSVTLVNPIEYGFTSRDVISLSGHPMVTLFSHYLETGRNRR